tara:strand:- start:383 stop:667 length:285 start_codon:yes stop_codon:yes gene_type:complete
VTCAVVCVDIRGWNYTKNDHEWKSSYLGVDFVIGRLNRQFQRFRKSQSAVGERNFDSGVVKRRFNCYTTLSREACSFGGALSVHQRTKKTIDEE